MAVDKEKAKKPLSNGIEEQESAILRISERRPSTVLGVKGWACW